MTRPLLGLLDAVAAGWPSIPATLAVALVCASLGRLLAGGVNADRRTPAAFDLAAGWGIASAVTVAGGLAGVGVVGCMTALAIVGALSMVARRGNGATPLWREWALAVAVSLPLLLIVAASPPIMFDELSHWLPNARFVLEHGSLPRLDTPNRWASFPAYPYGGPFVTVAVSLIGGAWAHTGSALFTVLLYTLGGFAIADVVSAGRRSGRAAAGLLGVLALTLANPTFDPRIALSAHMDSASGLVLALAAVAAWQAMRSAPTHARGWWWRTGGLGLALVYTRDTNLALLGGLWLGVAAADPAIWRHPRQSWRARWPVVAVPFAGLAVWRLYRWHAQLPTPIPVLPLASWHWNAPWQVLQALLGDRIPAHPMLSAVTGLGVLLTVAAALIVIRRSADPWSRRFVTMSMMTATTWLLFIVWSYIASAAEGGIASANSLWRFLGQLGPLLIATLAVLCRRPDGSAAATADRASDRRVAQVLTAGVAAVLVGVPVLWPRYWQNSCRYPDVTIARQVAVAAQELIEAGDHVLVVHPVEALWLSTGIRYELGLDFARTAALLAPPGAAIETLVTTTDPPDVVFDLRTVDRDALRAGLPPPTVPVYRRRGSSYAVQGISVAGADLGCRSGQ